MHVILVNWSPPQERSNLASIAYAGMSPLSPIVDPTSYFHWYSRGTVRNCSHNDWTRSLDQFESFRRLASSFLCNGRSLRSLVHFMDNLHVRLTGRGSADLRRRTHLYPKVNRSPKLKLKRALNWIMIMIFATSGILAYSDTYPDFTGPSRNPLG
jgi:hypothetical protein